MSDYSDAVQRIEDATSALAEKMERNDEALKDVMSQLDDAQEAVHQLYLARLELNKSLNDLTRGAEILISCMPDAEGETK